MIYLYLDKLYHSIFITWSNLSYENCLLVPITHDTSLRSFDWLYIYWDIHKEKPINLCIIGSLKNSLGNFLPWSNHSKFYRNEYRFPILWNPQINRNQRIPSGHTFSVRERNNSLCPLAIYFNRFDVLSARSLLVRKVQVEQLLIQIRLTELNQHFSRLPNLQQLRPVLQKRWPHRMLPFHFIEI